MKPTFHHRLVNGPFEDPSLYVRLLWERRALLFDLGDIGTLDAGSLSRVTDVFVTHTHIDHFIGFDTLLRAHLRTEHTVRLFGPAGITGCVEGKLRGYTWNLIEQYPVRLEVFEVGDGTVRHTGFHARDSFKRLERKSRAFDGVVYEEELFRVRAVSLEHDIQCLGFALEEAFHINIDKAALMERGLPVGPWLGDLKHAIRRNAPDETEFNVSGELRTLRELRGLALLTRGQKVSYVMDAAPTADNLRRITRLVEGSDAFYCEAYFMEADSDRALERNHLTARTVGRMAREAGVKDLVVTHFSPKYRGTETTPEDEALEEFRKA